LTVRVRCPAKVNLFLAVGPRDASGYHPVRTVFQAISLFDWLIIDDATETTIVASNDPDFPEDNTIAKAVSLLQQRYPLPNLRVTLEQGIPPRSGLGGSSSDAAGILRAASRFVAQPLEPEVLLEIARLIGVDTPFFLVGGRARSEGYGERPAPLPDGPEEWMAVARPEIGCGSKEAYSRLDTLRYPFRGFPREDELYNDFERVAPEASLELKAMLLRLGAKDVALTGSGSAVFGRFASQKDAEQAAEALLDHGAPMAWAARTLTRAECLE
jgi:4-diphosphocytidyl-2-C-methyl-D-erythritol kinase